MKDITHYRNETLNFVDEMRRSFQNLVGDLSSTVKSYPTVDVREEESQYVVEAELAGLSEKDIDVSVHNNVLTIASIREEQKEESREGYIMRERRKSSFRRSFTLPEDADQEHIEGKFNQGLLTLTIPKEERGVTSKHIKITKGEEESK